MTLYFESSCYWMNWFRQELVLEGIPRMEKMENRCRFLALKGNL